MLLEIYFTLLLISRQRKKTENVLFFTFTFFALFYFHLFIYLFVFRGHPVSDMPDAFSSHPDEVLCCCCLSSAAPLQPSIAG